MPDAGTLSCPFEICCMTKKLHDCAMTSRNSALLWKFCRNILPAGACRCRTCWKVWSCEFEHDLFPVVPAHNVPETVEVQALDRARIPKAELNETARKRNLAGLSPKGDGGMRNVSQMINLIVFL